MEAQVLSLVSFGALASAGGTVLLLLRDLMFGGPAKARAGLSRFPAAADEQAPRGLSGSVDQWFNRLVLDTGLDWGPTTALLLLLWFGTLIGGAMFLWNENPMTAAAGMIVGMVLPLLYMTYTRTKRLQAIQESLPDTLDLLARAVRAGESLDQAMGLVGQKGAEPLATEFRRCAKQLEMGLSLPEAVRTFAQRVRLMEIRIFATTLTVHRQTGGNLALTMERLAAVVRDRLNFRRQLQATTGAGRFATGLIAVVGALLFVYLFFFQPTYIEHLLNGTAGRSMLALAVVLEVIGLAWIFRMLRSDY